MSTRDDRAFVEDMLTRIDLAQEFTAFRNFVIHVYWNIKLERIWEIVENDLPTLKVQLQNLLGTLPDHETDGKST
ncbi:MAG: hypothetical protein CL610_28870 [Anaerolineaceae bacterium]|nr:hypothetical protein [Anaerolineaceae bacterium]